MKVLNSHIHFDEVIIRIPAFPIKKISSLNNDKLIEFLDNEDFLDGIRLSSYKFAEILEDFEKNESPYNQRKVLKTLYKYAVRATTRCTPFGKFSAVGHAYVSHESKDKPLSLNRSFNAVLKIDGRLLNGLITVIEKEAFPLGITYFLNNTVVSIENESYYIEEHLKNSDIFYEFSKFESDEVVTDILQAFKNGLIPSEIYNFEKFEQINQTDLISFVQSLADSKILKSQLSKNFMEFQNPQRLSKYLSTLPQEIQESKIIQIVKSLVSQFFNFQNISTLQKNIIYHLDLLKIPFAEDDLIHCDSAIETKGKVFFPKHIQEDLYQCKELLMRLNSNDESTSFKKFKEEFFKRYEHRVVPLNEALDPRNGIGFPFTRNSKVSNLIQNLAQNVRPNNNKIELNEKTKFLLQKIINSRIKNENEIEITLNEVEQFKTCRFSKSFASHFSLLENNEVLFNSFSGRSGIDYISRFHHLSEEIDRLCSKIVQNEEYEEDCIIAEIVHVSELKAANLIPVKNYRSFEISIVNEAGSKKRLGLHDLLLRLNENGKIDLLSKTHQCVVFPILSNTLNFRRNSIPVFEFLCSLASQDNNSYIGFSWGDILSLFDYFPRVKFKNIIISPSFWRFSKDDCKRLGKLELSLFKTELQNRKTPKRFNVTSALDDDNLLFIDMTIDLGIEVLHDFFKRNTTVYIIESFLDKMSDQFLDEFGNKYANEIILPAIHIADSNKQPSIHTKLDIKNLINNNKNILYPVDSSWVYYKIYIGNGKANSLLTEIVLPIMEKLIQQEKIESWFFIRFYDDAFHLRLRFYSPMVESRLSAIEVISDAFGYLQLNGTISHLTKDAYKPENDRYTSEYINFIEKLFFIDSVCIVKFILNSSSDESWKFALKSIDDLFNTFNYDSKDKFEICTQCFDSFFIEHGGNSELTTSLNKKYNEYKKGIWLVLKAENRIEENWYAIAEEKKTKSHLIIEIMIENGFLRLEKSKKNDVVISIIHMSINRLFESNNRTHEMVIYYFLKNYYQAQLFMKVS